MLGKLIINVALTGMVPTKKDNPYLPETPEEIAEDCYQCYKLGASIAHLHAREDGKPTWRKEIYAPIIAAVRERCPDMIVCVSCSGRDFPEIEKRADVLDLEGDVKPEMASLTLGSLNFPSQASINNPETIGALAARMHERGIVPELEAFEVGMVDVSHYLIRKGVLRPPYYFNLLLGSRGTAALRPLNLAAMLGALPVDATWALAGIGQFQLPANVMSLSAGGHIRVGLEDNIYFDHGTKRLATNAMLVDRLVRIANMLGREPATPREARQMIGLPTPAAVKVSSRTDRAAADA